MWGDRPVAVKKLLTTWNDEAQTVAAINDAPNVTHTASNFSTSQRVQNEFASEIRFIRKIKHINIVLCYGAGVFMDGCKFLVLELCTRGSLRAVLKDKAVDWPMFRQMEIALHTARGINHLHHMKPISIHRDIKSANVLISEGWIAKIADFGSTKLIEKDPEIVELAKQGKGQGFQGGSLLWAAPEVIAGQKHSTRTDVYRYE